jgi:hypothetical protein
MLPLWGFDPAPLEPFVARVASRRVPADEIMALHEREQSMARVLRHLAVLEPERVTERKLPDTGIGRPQITRPRVPALVPA